MMRTSLLVLLAGMALGAGCSDDREAPSSVRISPTVSRVTGLYFDKDDRIGLTISRTSGDYVTNRLMTYDGSVFTASGLKWYESTQETSTLTAYYPYSEAGVPSAFSVEADQRQGCTPSDLLGAVAREVRPGSAPVAMVFYHLMSQALRGRGEQRFLAGRRSEDRRFGRRGRRGPRRAFGEGESGCGGGADRGFRGGARFPLPGRARAAADDAGCRGGVAGRFGVPQIRFRRPARRRQVLRPVGRHLRRRHSADRGEYQRRCGRLGGRRRGSSGPMAETTVQTEWITRGNTTGRWRSTEKSGWRRTCGTSRRGPSSEQEFGILRAVLR